MLVFRTAVAAFSSTAPKAGSRGTKWWDDVNGWEAYESGCGSDEV